MTLRSARTPTAWNLLPSDGLEDFALTEGEAILARARVLCSTRCGESRINPRWGTRLFDLSGRAADPLTESLARVVLRRDLARCLPELKILDLIVSANGPAALRVHLRLGQNNCQAELNFSFDLNRAELSFAPRSA
jgi:hypothetical protein